MKEMKIKPTVRYHLISTKRASIKTTEIESENVETFEPMWSVDESVQ
jgi:hypothetical protein